MGLKSKPDTAPAEDFATAVQRLEDHWDDALQKGAALQEQREQLLESQAFAIDADEVIRLADQVRDVTHQLGELEGELDALRPTRASLTARRNRVESCQAKIAQAEAEIIAADGWIAVARSFTAVDQAVEELRSSTGRADIGRYPTPSSMGTVVKAITNGGLTPDARQRFIAEQEGGKVRCERRIAEARAEIAQLRGQGR